MRRFRWIAVLVIAVLVALVVAAVVLVRPGLEDDRDRVDARWTPLRPTLITRYAKLGSVATALRDAGAGDRAVTADLDTALDRWKRYALLGPKHTDAATEATLANVLEGLAAPRAPRTTSRRRSSSRTMRCGRRSTRSTRPSCRRPRCAPTTVRSGRTRTTGPASSSVSVAGALGYDSRPVLVVGG